MPKEFERNQLMLHIDDSLVPYFERGNGDPVVVFPARDDAATAIIDKLAESHRVIAFDLSSVAELSTDKLAEKILAALTGIGVDHFGVIGIQSDACAALALAIAAPQRAERLILISARISRSGQLPDLGAVKSPTLVLAGTRDAPAAIEAGRLCRERISSCHLSFVYGAGNAMSADSLEACLSPVLQFLEEGEQFIIVRESQAIRP
jgi:pimeloyl-ACP methyl ester carboxylesterase